MVIHGRMEGLNVDVQWGRRCPGFPGLPPAVEQTGAGCSPARVGFAHPVPAASLLSKGGQGLPNRILRDSCTTSPTLAVVSDFGERLFWRLIAVADDHGRYHASSAVVMARCFSEGAPGLTLARIDAALDEIESSDLIRRYQIIENGAIRNYLYFPTWAKHQRLRSATSKFPDPPPASPLESSPRSNAAICGALLPSAATRGETPPMSPGDGDGDGNGNGDDKGQGQNPAPKPRWSPPASLPGFAEFWRLHPHKVEGAVCERIWRDRKLEGIADAINGALREQLSWEKFRGEQIQFMKRAPAWLRARRWEDEAPPAPLLPVADEPPDAATEAAMARKAAFDAQMAETRARLVRYDPAELAGRASNGNAPVGAGKGGLFVELMSGRPQRTGNAPGPPAVRQEGK